MVTEPCPQCGRDITHEGKKISDSIDALARHFLLKECPKQDNYGEPLSELQQAIKDKQNDNIK